MSDRAPDATIADLAGHPGWELLRQRAVESRDRYMGNLAKTLYDDPSSLDPAAVEYRRGFFRGIFWLLNNPVFEARELERVISEQRAGEAQEATDDD